MTQIKPDNILKGPFCRKKSELFAVTAIGETQIRIEAVGLETQRFYNPILSAEDIKAVEILEEKPLRFG